MENTKRAFLSLSIPSEIKDGIFEIVQNIPHLELHPKNNFHITIKFLGDITEEQEEQVTSLMEFVAGQFEPFPIEFIGLKIVEQRLRLLAQSTIQIQHLYETIKYNLKKIQLFQDDRIGFEPHVTLGKIITQELPPSAQHLDLSGLPFVADHLTLYQTVRGEGVPVFKPLSQIIFQTR